LLAFVVVNACCIRLRLDQPRAERPFRVPLSLGRVPLLPVAGMALALALVTQFDAVVYLIVAGVLLAAFGIYAVRTRVTD
jgi:basic amino acid/polyamine antiporter, APA family